MSHYAESETSYCTCESVIRKNKKLVVVDTPGMFDTRTVNELIIREVIRSCAFLSPGPHAIIFVFKAGDKFTEENKKTFTIYERLFGKTFWNHTFLVITNWDDMEKKDLSLDEYIDSCPDLQDVVRLCGTKCYAMGDAGTNQETEVDTLIDAIEGNQNGVSLYNELFNRMEPYLNLLDSKATLIEVSDESFEIITSTMVQDCQREMQEQ